MPTGNIFHDALYLFIIIKECFFQWIIRNGLIKLFCYIFERRKGSLTFCKHFFIFCKQWAGLLLPCLEHQLMLSFHFFMIPLHLFTGLFCFRDRKSVV